LLCYKRRYIHIYEMFLMYKSVSKIALKLLHRINIIYFRSKKYVKSQLNEKYTMAEQSTKNFICRKTLGARNHITEKAKR